MTSGTLRSPLTQGHVLRLLALAEAEVVYIPALSDDPLRPARVAFGLIRPRSGVALLDRAPQILPGAVSLFRARLRRLCAGDPAADAIPIVYLSLTDQELERLPEVLDSAFDALPPLDPTNTLWTVIARQAFVQALDPVSRADLAASLARAAPQPERALAPALAPTPAVDPAPRPEPPLPRRNSGGLVGVLWAVSLLALASGGGVVWLFLDPLGTRMAGRPAAVDGSGWKPPALAQDPRNPEAGKVTASARVEPAPAAGRPSPTLTTLPATPAEVTRGEPTRVEPARPDSMQAELPRAAPSPSTPLPAPMLAVPVPAAPPPLTAPRMAPSDVAPPIPPRPAEVAAVALPESRPSRPEVIPSPAPASMEAPSAPEREAPSPPEPTVARQVAPQGPPPSQPAPAVPVLSTELLTALVRRGDAMLAANDVSAARLLYERAATAGSAEAARAMGRTFDPSVLAALGLRAGLADPIAAATWYGRAAAMGDTEAPALTQRLAAGGAR